MIPINRPDFSEQDLKAYRALQQNSPENGDGVRMLEHHFQELFGQGHYALFTGSAKTALYLLFKALGLNQGEIITSPLTCFAALSPIVAAGLTPRYVDVDPMRMLMDERLVQPAINDKTKGILSIALGGCPGRMHELRQIANKFNIPLIEDCAQALGSKYNETLLGSFGDHAFFSFTKHLSLVGGGLLLSKNSEVIQRARAIQNHWPLIPKGLIDYRLNRDLTESNLGTPEADRIYAQKFLSKTSSYTETNPKNTFDTPGVAHRPSDFQAHMLMRQLHQLDQLIERRRTHAAFLKNALRDLPFLHFQEDEGASSYAKLYVRSGHPNEKVISALMKLGVDAKQLTKSHGLYLQKRIDQTTFMNDTSILKCQNYLSLHDLVFELPLSSKMTETELNSIVVATKTALS